MRRYSVPFGDTNTAATTLAGITSDADVLPSLYGIEIGSVATPADAVTQYEIKRYTAAGTSTAVTPVPHDPNCPASQSTAGENHSVEPTYTANKTLKRFAVYQRTSYQWEVPPEYGFWLPGVAASGVGLFSAVSASAFAIVGTLKFAE